MENEKGKKIYCTNMKDSDPVIEKFMKEYLKEKQEIGEGVREDDLIVNFDISYPDGLNENHTCGSESKVFGGVDSGCIESKIDAEEMKCYYSDTDIDIKIPSVDREKDSIVEEEYKYEEEEKLEERKCDYDDHREVEQEEFYEEDISSSYCEEIEKKHVEEYDDTCECSSVQSFFEEEEDNKWLNCEDEWNEVNRVDCYENKEKEYECRKKIQGEIVVYSTLTVKEGTRIKGVKINLYKLNGVCPELVDSKETNCDGKVIFTCVPEGSYRVIQLIDKRYFDKPSYINWNEVTIDECNNRSIIFAVNKIKNQRCCRKGH
ncbi:hypothetical protein ACQPU1_03555 [Clostridium paraputrificum]|uniref:hypothetical protein n=1 Tax=Clostridium TaxID=1485 RepID=UPI003D351D32